MAAKCNVEEESVAVVVDLATLLDAGDGAMVTLVAEESRLAAHKAVLIARSPVFAAMFSHDMQEARSGHVVIPDLEGAVLRQLLAYLYTLQVPQLPGMAPQLLAAADKYGLSVLKSHCEKQLVEQLSVETAAAAAVLAVRHSCPSLREAAIAFINAHIHQVMTTQGWADAMRNQPEDLIEVSQLLARPPAENSTQSSPAVADSQPRSDHSQTPDTAAPTTPAADPDTVSRFRVLSAEEKGRRLIQSAKHGAEEEVRALLAAGTEVGTRDEDWGTALHWAAVWGHVALARCLLGAGAEVDARNKWQVTPLHLAARYGHVDVVWLLLAASSDINARNEDGWTPLHRAAYFGQPGAAAALLEAGAELEARDNDGRTPLDVARQQNHRRLTDMLTCIVISIKRKR